MSITRSAALKMIAQAPRGTARAKLLKNDEIRKAVLSSGANVTLYTGKPHTANSAKDALSDVYIGLILRKNRFGKLDGLGALGGLAERTDATAFRRLNKLQRLALIGQKDDVILDGTTPILTTNLDLIRQNNVLREMREELADLGITNITIDAKDLVLVEMPKVKDDNYMINIWNGKGECYAITPFCHLYEDKIGLIDEISHRAQQKVGGEAVTYMKIPLFEALMAYGHKGSPLFSLEDGRHAKKDYRYPHEYLTAWRLAADLLKHKPDRLVVLAQEVQKSADHPISFEKLAKATGQTMLNVAKAMHITSKTLQQMEQSMKIVQNTRWKLFDLGKAPR